MTEKTMTVKEVSELLGVTPEAIKWHIRELYPKLMQNGVSTVLTEEQATEIKKRMQPTSQLVGAVTDIEMQEKALFFMDWMRSKIEEQKKVIESQIPKVEFADNLSNSDKCFGIGETTKLLKLTVGRTRFFQILRNDKILMCDNLPYQDYRESGYFKVFSKRVEMGENQPVEFISTTFVTSKGLNWLYKKYKHLVEKDAA